MRTRVTANPATAPTASSAFSPTARSDDSAAVVAAGLERFEPMLDPGRHPGGGLHRLGHEVGDGAHGVVDLGGGVDRGVGDLADLVQLAVHVVEGGRDLV